MNIKVDKGLAKLTKRLKSSPLRVVLDKAARDTAAFGKGKIMRSTAVNTGQTRRGWNTRKISNAVYSIWNRFLHAQFLESGTGLFGPKKKRITSKTGKVLRWETSKKNTGTGTVFAMSTAGMKAQPMVEPNVDIIQKDLNKRVKSGIRKLWRSLKRK